MFNSKINVISNKRKKDSQEKDTLKIHKRCVINYCFFTVEGNKVNQRETIQNEYDLQIYQCLMHDSPIRYYEFLDCSIFL